MKDFSATTLITLIIAYLTIIGFAWHIGFWSTFGINFFEYANVTDLFKSTIYPFLQKSTTLNSMVLLNLAFAFCIFNINPSVPKLNAKDGEIRVFWIDMVIR